jgi:hypothetical protein
MPEKNHRTLQDMSHAGIPVDVDEFIEEQYREAMENDEVWPEGEGPPLYRHGWLDDAEEREGYRPGGFHRVHLGDYIGKNCRYLVIQKLGNGGLVTVWLCRDEGETRFVALKIIMADASGDECAELRLVHRKDLDFNQPGGKHIALPEDYFWIDGPNGRHLVLVLPVMGP